MERRPEYRPHATRQHTRHGLAHRRPNNPVRRAARGGKLASMRFSVAAVLASLLHARSASAARSADFYHGNRHHRPRLLSAGPYKRRHGLFARPIRQVILPAKPTVDLPQHAGPEPRRRQQPVQLGCPRTVATLGVIVLRRAGAALLGNRRRPTTHARPLNGSAAGTCATISFCLFWHTVLGSNAEGRPPSGRPRWRDGPVFADPDLS